MAGNSRLSCATKKSRRVKLCQTLVNYAPCSVRGVYSELTIGEVTFSGLSATNNALVGAKAKASFPGSLKFQRTVVVTKIFAQKMGAVGTLVYLIANHHKSTGTAAGTAFASIKCSATDSLIPVDL